MGTRANIRIEFLTESFLLPKKEKDQILLFCGSDGYPFGTAGIISLMIEAYENLKNPEKTAQILGGLTPDSFASELIRVSIYEEYGCFRIVPASRLMYQQYDEKGYFVDCAYKYTCNFWIENGSSYEMDLTVVDSNIRVSKGMNEWKSVLETVFLIAVAQAKHWIFMNETIPCHDCVVRPTCIYPRKNELFANKPCEPLKEYKINEISALREKLPDWSVPLVFRNE